MPPPTSSLSPGDAKNISHSPLNWCALLTDTQPCCFSPLSLLSFLHLPLRSLFSTHVLVQGQTQVLEALGVIRYWESLSRKKITNIKFGLKVNIYFKWAKKTHQILETLESRSFSSEISLDNLPEMLTDFNLVYLPNTEYPRVAFLKPQSTSEFLGNLWKCWSWFSRPGWSLRVYLFFFLSFSFQVTYLYEAKFSL